MDAPAQAAERVNLVVRNVYTPAQSLALRVDPRTRVGELKRRLSLEFPLSPAVPTQKLIFGGKICRDEEPLAQVLAQVQSSHLKDGDAGSDEPVVFHLLVSAPASARKSVELKPQTHVEVAEAQDSPRPSSSDDAAQTRSFDAQPTQTQTPMLFGQTPAMTQQQHNLYRQSVLMQQQAMVLQQIQYLQFMLVQQRQQPATPDQSNAFAAHYAAAPYGHFYGLAPPQMFPAQARADAAAPHVAAPVPAAAPAAAHEQAPADPQDRPMLVEMAREVFPLLDFRMALKMAFMLFIIGQDTPLDRILMLGLLSFISYLRITGIFAKIYQVYNRRRSANGEAEANAPAAPNAADAAGAAISNSYGMLTRVLRISADRGLVHDVKYFVVGLLLSLVPAWHPQPIQGAAPMHENAIPDDVPLQGI
ncbi:hypothetical protein PR003_g14667 [Phytophthora rubi]|uniref:Ubiquitin-like domain-containing protein n=1 Tax=Phytophthora rubi TaxID=129364 RepID=A0A6A4EU52_9STRA|nr:hypothetical protein PR003_g14667 [Phytophthora rubi]